MPYNIGRKPPHEFIDIKFRNGQVRRNVKTDSWRFRAWDFESDWDIVAWQKARPVDNGLEDRKNAEAQIGFHQNHGKNRQRVKKNSI